MTIHIAADHAGFALKEVIKKMLHEEGFQTYDHGAFEYHENDDYPDVMVPCAQAVAADQGTLGIILGGSGQGEQMITNKIKGVRALEYYGGNLEIIRLGREHNDANILSLGARFIGEDEVLLAVKLFLSTPFSQEERHIRRLEAMNTLGEEI
jgi:ribose 5-phosphate isomerase B